MWHKGTVFWPGVYRYVLILYLVMYLYLIFYLHYCDVPNNAVGCGKYHCASFSIDVVLPLPFERGKIDWIAEYIGIRDCYQICSHMWTMQNNALCILAYHSIIYEAEAHVTERQYVIHRISPAGILCLSLANRVDTINRAIEENLASIFGMK